MVQCPNGKQVPKKVYFNSDQLTGGLDSESCLTRDPWGNCQCGRCAICGYGKHYSVHCTYFTPPDFVNKSQRPYGHRFVPRPAPAGEE